MPKKPPWSVASTVIPLGTLHDALEYLNGERDIPAHRPGAGGWAAEADADGLDLADVRGHRWAKRALEIAAAGGHNLLMVGPPGSGKTMLARRLGTILPPLALEEAIEISAVWSVAGLLLGRSRARARAAFPCAAPHHVGSGIDRRRQHAASGRGEPGPFGRPLPRRAAGVLSRACSNRLRQPLEDGSVVVSRAAGSAAFPARFQLVGAANHCRRGCASLDACVCSPGERQQYLARLSRPLLDRIDLHLEVPALPYAELSAGGGEPSAEVRARVEAARRRQLERLAGSGARVNARMSGRQVRRFCAPPPEADATPPAGGEPPGPLRPRARPRPQGRPHYRRPGRM